MVWNDVRNIEKTMLSVLNQTYPNVEYVVIDGKSTDGTWEVIEKYKERLSYCISEPDSGIYDAMNKAIKEATGEWILFMNCGDGFYDNHTIEKAFNCFVDNGESLVYGDCYVVNHPQKPDCVVKARAQSSNKIEYAPGFHQAIFTRTVELKQHPFKTKYRIIADFVFFYDLYQRNHRWHYTKSVICYYDYTGVSSTSRIDIMHEKAKFYTSRLKFTNAAKYWIVYIKRLITG
mgnify:CR=1 FL=1